jgi:DNA-binding transcriptional MerR regulator
MPNPSNPYASAPYFSRSDVAKILNCSVLTVRNQESKGSFPEPQRAANNYRIYTIADVINLQFIYHKAYNFNAILSILWDKGYTDADQCRVWVVAAMEEHAKRSGQVATITNAVT